MDRPVVTLCLDQLALRALPPLDRSFADVEATSDLPQRETLPRCSGRSEHRCCALQLLAQRLQLALDLGQVGEPADVPAGLLADAAHAVQLGLLGAQTRDALSLRLDAARGLRREVVGTTERLWILVSS
jgi:hypothetical protein